MSDHKQVPLIPRPEQTFNAICPEPTPRCACGHPSGDHQSANTGFPHRPQFGYCFISGCGCREYTDARRAA